MEPSESEWRNPQSSGDTAVKSNRQPLIYVVLTLTCTVILVLFTDVERDLMRKLTCDTVDSIAGPHSDACD